MKTFRTGWQALAFLFPVLLLMAFSESHGQSLFPPDGVLYTHAEIPRVDIQIHPDSLAHLISEESNELEYGATFIWTSSAVTDTFLQAGFGLRGNTSLVSPKKSFQVSFNTYVPGGKFKGVEKLNLNGDHNDPSVMRSFLAWETFRQSGVPVPRCNYATLYINGDYFGLYANVEAIDEEMMESRFGNKDGNLYKCLWPADLVFQGLNPDAYKMEANGRRVYDLKTNTDADNYSDLAHLIDVLNNTSLASLPAQLETVFDVNSYLRYLAAEVLVGHWDCYSYNKNNYYLYRNTHSGQFEFIPYDADNTFGIDWFGIDWSTRSVYSFAPSSESRPLTKRLMQVQMYRDRYSFYLNRLASQWYNTGNLFPLIDAQKATIRPLLENDLLYPQNYGWDMADFDQSYTQALGAHVPVGLKPFISQRHASLSSQLQLNSIAPIISRVNFNSPLVGQSIGVNAFVEDDAYPPQVKLFFQRGSLAVDSVLMADDGLSFDGQAYDGVWGAVVAGMDQPGSFYYWIKATDVTARTTRYPMVGQFSMDIAGLASGALSINELMADNSGSSADQAGDHDDWLELVNQSAQDLLMVDLYLSDDAAIPGKWKLPEVNLPSGAFYLVWCDGEPGEGENHASFKLDKSGEEVSLFHFDGSAYQLWDRLAYGAQTADVSFGRWPDGNGVFQSMITPTPGQPNTVLTAAVAGFAKGISLKPAGRAIRIVSDEKGMDESFLRVTDLSGRDVFSVLLPGRSGPFDLLVPTPLDPGLYLASLVSTRAPGAMPTRPVRFVCTH